MFNAKNVMNNLDQKLKLERRVAELEESLNRERNTLWFTEEELNIFEEMINIFYASPNSPSKESILLSIENCRRR